MLGTDQIRVEASVTSQGSCPSEEPGLEFTLGQDYGHWDVGALGDTPGQQLRSETSRTVVVGIEEDQDPAQ